MTVPISYSGLPGNEAGGAALTVSFAASTTPIVIQTTAPHGLKTGEEVSIYQVEGNKAANGRFYVYVTDVDQITLYTGWSGGAVSGPVASDGTYAHVLSPGYVKPLAFANLVQLTRDGVSAINASTFNAIFEGALDREAHLARHAIGAQRLSAFAFINAAIMDDDPMRGWASRTTSVDTWVAGADIGIYLSSDINVQPGDVVEVNLSTSGYIVSGTTNVALRVRTGVRDYNSATEIVASNSSCAILPKSASGVVGVNFIGFAKNYGARGGKLYLTLYDRGITAGTAYALVGGLTGFVKVWSVTSWGG